MDITRSQLEKIIKEELSEEILNEVLPERTFFWKGLYGVAATIGARFGLDDWYRSLDKAALEKIKRNLGTIELKDEAALTKFFSKQVEHLEDAVDISDAPPEKREELKEAIRSPENLNNIATGIAAEIAPKIKGVCHRDQAGTIFGVKCMGFSYAEEELFDHMEQAGLTTAYAVYKDALIKNGVNVRARSAGELAPQKMVPAAKKIATQVIKKAGVGAMVKEVKIRKSYRHVAAPVALAATGLPIGAFLGGAAGGGPTPLGGALAWGGAAAGSAAGAAAGAGVNTLYDKYLLRKIATEKDLITIASLMRDETEETDEPWDIDTWLDEAISSLSPKQKKNIMYEEEEFVNAGQEHGEPEMASQIADYFAKEGMLDNEERPQLPAEEIPQIGVQDEMPGEEERMVAESFGRMNQLAGVIKG